MTSEERKRFQSALGTLYSVFAAYPLRSNTEACPCCHEPEDEPRVHSKSLRDLTTDDLESYGHSALLTWGTVEDFKHFLPRLFEITAETSDIGWVDTPIIFAKLRHAQWQDWPENERIPVEEYITTLWRWFLADADHVRDSEDLLCGIAHAVDDLAPFLSEWRNSGLVGLHKLAAFVADQANIIAKKGHLSDAFWGDRIDQMHQAIDWLLESDTRDILERAFFESASDPVAQDLAAAVDWLDWLSKFRAARGGAES